MQNRMAFNLPEFLYNIEALTIEKFLQRLIEHLKNHLSCVSGSLYFYSSASNRLEMVCHSDGQSAPITFEIGEGIAGKAFEENDLYWEGGSRLGTQWVDTELYPKDHFRAVAAMPIRYDNVRFAVICLDYTYGEYPPSDSLNYGLSQEEEKDLKSLWEVLQSSGIGKLLHTFRRSQLIRDLSGAGGSIIRMKTVVNDFVDNLKIGIRERINIEPSLIGVYLVDHQQQQIRTLINTGMPLGFEYTHSISFTEQDIQADIYRSRNIEIIWGNDLKRFNQAIYRRYSHKEYVRLFMPLFPLPRNLNCSFETPEYRQQKLMDMLLVQEFEGPNRMVYKWKDQSPPRPIVYATLELGFYRKNEEPWYYPWNRDLIMWTVLHALELSEDFFKASLMGVLENVGNLAGSIPGVALRRFTCRFPYRKEWGVREYPKITNWPVCVPRKEPYDDESCHRETSSTSYHIEKETICLTYAIGASSTSGLSFLEIYPSLKSFLERVATIANQAVDVSLRLNEWSLVQYEVLKDLNPTSSVGTFYPDRLIESICREAMLMSGAQWCRFYWFVDKDTTRSIDAKKLERFAPPLAWSNNGNILFLDNEEKLVRDAVSGGNPIYGDGSFGGINKGIPYCILPLELVDKSIRVLVMGFPERYKFENSLKLAIGKHSIHWISRLSTRDLILRNEFSALMARIRMTLKQTKEDLSEDRPRLPQYIKKLIVRFLDILDANAVLVTTHHKPLNGPSLMKRVFCYREDSLQDPIIEDYEFWNTDLIGPCLKSCNKNDLYIRDKRQERPLIREVVAELERASEKIVDQTRAEHLRKFSKHISGRPNRPSTLISIPIPSWVLNEPNRKGAMTVVLPGIHYFDRLHRQLILEIGALISEGLRSTRNVDKNEFEQKHIQQFEIRRAEFEHADHPDDIIGRLLRGMGRHPTNQNAEAWNIAEHAVIWNLDWDNREILFRSARGEGIKIFGSDKSLQNLPMDVHPLFKKISLAYHSQRPPKLENKFELWTFSLEEQQKNRLSDAYKQQIGRKFLVSFPIVNATDSVFGVMDLLRSQPFRPEESKVLKQLLYRVSRQICDAVDRCQQRRVKNITDELYSVADHALRDFQTQIVYSKIVQLLKEAFRCKHCDLFIELEGKMLLHTTTRKEGPKNAAERQNFWLEPDHTELEIIGTCHQKQMPILAHAKKVVGSPDHLSRELRNLISEDQLFERMVFPLKAFIRDQAINLGLLYLRGPITIPEKNDSDGYSEKPLKKGDLFTYEEFLLGILFSRSLQRIIQMVNLVEHQGWLVNELAHSMGQPLQILSSGVRRAIRRLPKTTENEKNTFREIKSKVDYGFELARDAKEHIGFLSRDNSEEDFEFKADNLSELVKECCDGMSVRALNNQNRIDYSGVKDIEPVPFHRRLMRRAIINLLDNACKYSWHSRYIEVALSESEGLIILTVTNYGIGIPGGHLGRIFEPYFRSRIPDSRGKRPGSGIGLAVVKEVVEVTHKGKVEVESNKGELKDGQIEAENIPGHMTIRPELEIDDTDIKDIFHTTRFKVNLVREKLEAILHPVVEKEQLHRE